jgi:WD40 repeat protein
VLILQGPNHCVEALTFSPDATTLYIVQGHHGIRAWNITDRTNARVEFEGRLVVSQFLFHPGGRWAFSACAHTPSGAPRRGRLIDLPTGTMRPFNAAGLERENIAFFPTAERLVSIGDPWEDPKLPPPGSRSRLLGWEMTTTGPVPTWHRSMPGNEHVLSVVALGDRFATADTLVEYGNGVNSRATNHHIRIRIRRASDGKPEAELPFPHPIIQQLLAGPRGDLLIGRSGTELHVWTAPDWRAPPRVVAGTRDEESEHYWPPRYSAAAFHPSGRYLLLANNEPSVTAFDTATWNPVQTWVWETGALRSVAVSPDGALAAAGSAGGTTVVWDLDL